MSVKQRHFSKEFKVHAINEVKLGESQASVARKYQLNPRVLNRWITEFETYGDNAFAGKGNTCGDQVQVAALNRKLDQLEAENELLKKALTQLDAIRSSTPSSGEES